MTNAKLDVRSRWLGPRQLKNKYQPKTYHQKDELGNEIGMRHRADSAANFLANNIWKREIGPERERNQGKLSEEIPELYLGIITMEEVKAYTKRTKRMKAPGPDEVPIEFSTEMTEETLELVLEQLNDWWINEEIPEDNLMARICLLYRKGNASNLKNYRPISLLNTITKMFASIMQKRLAAGLDKYLHKTPYGFRKD